MKAIKTLARSIAALAVTAITAAPALLVGASAAAEQAGKGQATEKYVSDDWTFTLTPYLWALSLEGDVTVRGQESEVDLGFDDILEKLNMAVMIEAEARKGRFGLLVNPLYATLEDKQTISGLGIEADVDVVVTSFGGYYRLGPWNLDYKTGAAGPKLVADVFAGARYTYLNLKLNVRGGPQGEGDEDWFDPIVGLRTLWFLSPRWTVLLMGDYGGFGVGSDYQWQVSGFIGYRFHLLGDDNAHAYAGYRYLRQDYDAGDGNKLEWDVELHGPVIGLSWHF